jgi:hypothetical protein
MEWTALRSVLTFAVLIWSQGGWKIYQNLITWLESLRDTDTPGKLFKKSWGRIGAFFILLSFTQKKGRYNKIDKGGMIKSLHEL